MNRTCLLIVIFCQLVLVTTSCTSSKVAYFNNAKAGVSYLLQYPLNTAAVTELGVAISLKKTIYFIHYEKLHISSIKKEPE